MNNEFPKCERCGQRNSFWYVIFPEGKVFPYLQICKVCVADIGAWMDGMSGHYRWDAVEDGDEKLLWTKEQGQLLVPDDDSPTGYVPFTRQPHEQVSEG